MLPNAESRRPGVASGSQKVIAATDSDRTSTDRHPALDALDGTPWWNAMLWRQTIERLRPGRVFTVDELQADDDLPDIAGIGGLMMRLHREAVVERVGYRTSSRPSRAAGVVAVWRRC